MTNIIGATIYLLIGCFCSAVAKKQEPLSHWAFMGPALLALWPVLVPLGLLISLSNWIYDKL
jgi:hypothetical protein